MSQTQVQTQKQTSTETDIQTKFKFAESEAVGTVKYETYRFRNYKTKQKCVRQYKLTLLARFHGEQAKLLHDTDERGGMMIWRYDANTGRLEIYEDKLLLSEAESESKLIGVGQ